MKDKAKMYNNVTYNALKLYEVIYLSLKCIVLIQIYIYLVIFNFYNNLFLIVYFFPVRKIIRTNYGFFVSVHLLIICCR